MSMTPLQARFVEEYLIELNAKEAAIRAGYSPKTAKQKGYALLKIPKIYAAIKAAKKARSERTEINQDEVLQELHHLAFSNLADIVEWGPDGATIKDSADLTPEQQRCVLEVTVTKTGKDTATTKLKLHDKKGSLELLGRHLGTFPNNVNLSGALGVRHEDAIKDLE